MELPAEIYSVDSVRRLDSAAINDAGISGYALMTRAAQAALDVAIERYPDAKRWQVLCGAGNNGGDGYVLARLAAQHGIAVSVIALTPAEDLKGDASTACVDFAAEGGGYGPWEGELDDEAELLVDGMLGSGLDREVGGVYAEVVQAVNAHGAPVLALDIPTGLHGDNGSVMGCAVEADVTVTFVGLKSGLFLGEAPDFVGELHFAGLDIPAEQRQSVSAEMRRIDRRFLRRALPRRKRNAHKGDFGHLLLIGGGPGMPGAIRLAGEAALRSGAGLVSIASHPSHAAAIVTSRPELMCHGIEESGALEPLLGRATTIGIGPGLGTDRWAREIFRTVIKCKLPMVIDADALNMLALISVKADHWVLTPHPGEAARMLESSSGEVQADRPKAVAALQERYGGTVVLKGAGTLISAGGGPAWLCSAGNPGMSAPGMGDVLTGIIAGLLAQGLSQEDAAVAGVEVHARSGDAAAERGERGLLASEVLRELRSWVNP